MPETSPTLTNRQAREHWLNRQRLSQAPCGKSDTTAFTDCVSDLGMVQLDSIGVLARAHHHILWSRQSAWREPAYNRLLASERSVFEHFSHDAVILPMETYPYWQRQFRRRAERFRRSDWGKSMSGSRTRNKLIDHITRHGPVCSRDLASHQKGKPDKSAHAWARPDHKMALDYLWLSGQLSVSHRENFIKYYDLAERIIPDRYREQQVEDQLQVNWLCERALKHLGFASAGEIQRFWDACDLQEVHAWIRNPSIPIMPVEYLDTRGNRIRAFAPADLESSLAASTRPTSRVRIVSPFDPAIRDRQRLQRLFGFEYRIEIYVPAARRRYGYYVCPLLEGNRVTGRIDVRADRAKDQLVTRAWWLEPGVKDTDSRRHRVTRELKRLARLAGVGQVAALPNPELPRDRKSTLSGQPR